jgi:S1-C subfamily serine protease
MRVTEGGILDKARVKAGYIITAINEKPIRTVSDLAKVTTQVELIEGVYPDGRIVNYSLSR